MSFITPTNNVKLLTGIPFNNDYENTLYFQNRTAQYNYFASKVKYVNSVAMSWNDVSYQRYMRNAIKLEINAESIYDCNYMMFQNTNFGSRWFYAFITNIEYVANQVTLVYYQIDAIQTWLLDCTINPSFVKRMHYATDSMYVSRVPENLELGEYQIDSITYDSRFYDSVYVVAVTELPSGTSNLDITRHTEYFKRVKGYGTGLYYLCFPVTLDGIKGVNTVIRKYTTGIFNGVNVDSIAMIFEAPKIMFLSSDAQVVNVSTVLGGTENYGTMYSPWGATESSANTDPDTSEVTVPFTYSNNKWWCGSHAVRNMKLIQYPYNFIYMFDGKGNHAVYNYEDFYADGNDSPVCKFKYVTTGNVDSSIMVIPLKYKGAAVNRNETFVFKGFPQCSWNNDLFKAWYAQNGGVIGSAVRMISGMDTENIGTNFKNWIGGKDVVVPGKIRWNMETGEDGRKHRTNQRQDISYQQSTDFFDQNLSSVGSGIMGELGKMLEHSKMPTQAVGNFNTEIGYYEGVHAPMITAMHIRQDYAERIDNYFDMFGYACNDVTTVDYWNRPHWNYIQTVGLNIIASIPEGFAKQIVTIFENGIRFWKNASEVGQYNLDNSPTA